VTAHALQGGRRASSETDDRKRFWALTWTLAVTDWKLRFYGSVLGYFWSLARPFMLFGVIYLVFSKFAKLGADVKHYPVYILFALVMFQFFGETTSNGLTSLVDREHLLRKVRFPRLVIPLAVSLTSLFNLLMTLLAVLVFAIANGVYPMWSWLQLPLLVATLAVLSLGLAMLLSALFVRYRDISPIWEVVSQALFYASPILYVTTMVPESFQHAYVAAPLAAIFAQMRHAVIDPSAPPVWEAIGGAERLLIPGGMIVGAFALGWWVFHREAPRIAENL
jgi:ABC-2 type transport system permease protein